MSTSDTTEAFVDARPSSAHALRDRAPAETATAFDGMRPN